MAEKVKPKAKGRPKERGEFVELPSGPVKVGSKEAVPISGGKSEPKEVDKAFKKAAKEKVFSEPARDD